MTKEEFRDRKRAMGEQYHRDHEALVREYRASQSKSSMTLEDAEIIELIAKTISNRLFSSEAVVTGQTPDRCCLNDYVLTDLALTLFGKLKRKGVIK